MSFSSWLAAAIDSGWRKSKTGSRKPSRFRPQLEALEDRALPSTYYAATASDLIADLKAANTGGGSSTIVLTAPTSVPYDLTAVNNTKDGPTGLPMIKKAVTIVGNGDTIDRLAYTGLTGVPAFRLFDVASSGSLTLQNLTLQNGLEYGNGGAISNQGTLALSQVTVQNNTADGVSPLGAGGGIWSNGSLTVTNSTIDANIAQTDFGGPAYGGGLFIAGGTVSITGSAFGNPNGYSGNIARGSTAYGGAVYIAAGTVTLNADTFGPVDAAWSTSGNSAIATGGDGYGGAVYVAGGSVTFTNDIIVGNYVEDLNNLDGIFWGDYGGYGGGIYIARGATVCIDSFTVNSTNNNISNGGNIYGPYTLLA